MRLHYYNGRAKNLQVGNFGDDLNPWLWNQLIPELSDQNEDICFVGIGTLLNEHLPQIPQKVIFGSGVGYGKVPSVDATWKIYFVRGALSAKALCLPPELGITDPAILVKKCFSASGQKRYRWSYIPHFSEQIHNGAAWKELCEGIGIHYIDPTAPLEQVLIDIAETEILLAEAMHGAIVADALRTPWVAVKSKAEILDFKWSDWLSTTDLPYKPLTVKRFASRLGKKGLLRYCDYQSIRAQMIYLKHRARPMLSSSAKHSELEEKVMLKLEQLKLDLANGLFS